ncbi:hypothetical protein [Streptomyces sp. NPDC058045]|uniref:hypothetical protein n=1 Tax=Streptomyces sp. NPDC058045 TaxID=3346311 RepID=UPI0036E40228
MTSETLHTLALSGYRHHSYHHGHYGSHHGSGGGMPWGWIVLLLIVVAAIGIWAYQREQGN